MRLVEIRSYKLKPGTAAAFHDAVANAAVPMLLRWRTDVVAYGHGAAEDDTYFLVRAYASVDDLRQQQDAFYGSAEWRDGPREAIVSRIESHLSTVLRLPETAVDEMRRANLPASFAARDEQSVHDPAQRVPAKPVAP